MDKNKKLNHPTEGKYLIKEDHNIDKAKTKEKPEKRVRENIFKKLGINQDDIDRLDDFYKRAKK